MAQYEVAVLYHPDLEIDLEKAESRVSKLISENGGSIKKADNWGKRKLAYKIRNQEYGVYVFYDVELPESGVKKVHDTLNITDEVMRFLITRPDLKRIAKAEAAKDAAKKREAERSEVTYTEGTKQESTDEE